MTPDELKRQMQEIVDGTHPRQKENGSRGWADDPDEGHDYADRLLVKTLRELGYGEAADIYEAQTRWFA